MYKNQLFTAAKHVLRVRIPLSVVSRFQFLLFQAQAFLLNSTHAASFCFLAVPASSPCNYLRCSRGSFRQPHPHSFARADMDMRVSPQRGECCDGPFSVADTGSRRGWDFVHSLSDKPTKKEARYSRVVIYISIIVRIR